VTARQAARALTPHPRHAPRDLEILIETARAPTAQGCRRQGKPRELPYRERVDRRLPAPPGSPTMAGITTRHAAAPVRKRAGIG